MPFRSDEVRELSDLGHLLDDRAEDTGTGTIARTHRTALPRPFGAGSLEATGSRRVGVLGPRVRHSLESTCNPSRRSGARSQQCCQSQAVLRISAIGLEEESAILGRFSVDATSADRQAITCGVERRLARADHVDSATAEAATLGVSVGIRQSPAACGRRATSRSFRGSRAAALAVSGSFVDDIEAEPGTFEVLHSRTARSSCGCGGLGVIVLGPHLRRPARRRRRVGAMSCGRRDSRRSRPGFRQ